MPEVFPSLLLFAVVATITPGGATTLATASGVRFGFQRSLPLVFGIAAGLAILAASAASGLAALLQGLPGLGLGLKLAGTAYLFWLAWRICSAGTPDDQAADAARPLGFASGAALLLVNPKAWAMVFGAAASFASLSAQPLELAVVMAGTFGAAAVGSLCLWCAGGSLLARALREDWQWRMVNITLGLLLAASVLPIWIA